MHTKHAVLTSHSSIVAKFCYIQPHVYNYARLLLLLLLVDVITAIVFARLTYLHTRAHAKTSEHDHDGVVHLTLMSLCTTKLSCKNCSPTNICAVNLATTLFASTHTHTHTHTYTHTHTHTHTHAVHIESALAYYKSLRIMLRTPCLRTKSMPHMQRYGHAEAVNDNITVTMMAESVAHNSIPANYTVPVASETPPTSSPGSHQTPTQ